MRHLLRAAFLIALAMALFEPVWSRSSDRLQVVFALDVSSSVGAESLAGGLDWLAEAANRRDADVSFLAFAGSAQTLGRIDDLRHLKVTDGGRGAAPGTIDRSATDLESALRLARSAFDPGVVKRLVLLSDGLATSGDPRAALGGLIADRVRLDTVPLATAVGRPVVARVTLVSPPRARSPAPLEVEVLSGVATTSRLVLTVDGQELTATELEVAPGSQLVRLDPRYPEPGEVELLVELDGSVQWRQPILIGPRPGALVVAQAGRGKALADLLGAQGWRVTVVEPSAVGTRSGKLAEWDAVVLSNVAAKALGEPSLEALRDYTLGGGGLLFAGGDATFGEEGYSESAIEPVLPLRFNVEEERTDVALMVALDKSYSMKGAKIELAKEATKAALGELEDRHRFGVVAFDWEPYDVVPLQLANNRQQMLDAISRIEASAQTNFYPALESCLRQLSEVEAEVKHVILLSDGKTYPDDYEKLIARMRAAEITVSTVGVGSEADRELLADIARWGDGQTYFVEDAKRVQRILLDEARGKLEETLVEEPVRAVVAQPNRALRGIVVSAAPALLGHLNLEPRDESEIVLETDTGKPLLARRNVGLGRTWIFTSDLEGRWSAPWFRWSGFGPLLSQVLHDAAGRKEEPGLDFRIRRDQQRLVATLRALDDGGRHRNGLEPKLRVSAGSRNTETPMRQTGPGFYAADLELAPSADHPYVAELWLDGRRQGLGSVYYPESDDLRPGLPDHALLRQLAAASGGHFQPSLDQVFERSGEHATRRVELWPALVALALALFVVEVLLRRTGRLSPRPEPVVVRPATVTATVTGAVTGRVAEPS